MSGARKTHRVRDPVHGLVSFGGSGDPDRDETDRIAWRLVDTPEFQRLRRIRQLGFSDLVFPGATHSRFAHSIGVYHTARRLADVVARRLGEEHDTERERIALLAALLHDIGHGPFSHVFEAAAEAAGKTRRHEEWSALVIQDDGTGVNRVLREVDEDLPGKIASLLKDETPDIYASVVSSQFDADRLDYIRRDRSMAGVGFGHIDFDWLLDCLEVGTVTVGRDAPVEAQCLYLGPKGLQVAEEYLEARSRLYRMVYMHKTTRAAEKMLEALLGLVVSEPKHGAAARREPLLAFLLSDKPALGSYLALDDATVWAAIALWSGNRNRRISELARRLRERKLYKCVDIGVRDTSGGNLYSRFRLRLSGDFPELHDKVFFDDAEVRQYKWYDFDSMSALNKILVKRRTDSGEPEDIATVSEIAETLRKEKHIQRVYAPDKNSVDKLEDILGGIAT